MSSSNKYSNNMCVCVYLNEVSSGFIWVFRNFTRALPDLDEELEQSVASPVYLDTPNSGALSGFSLSSSSFFCPSLHTAGCKSTPPVSSDAPLVCLASRLRNKLTESSSEEESSLLISQAISVSFQSSAERLWKIKTRTEETVQQ